MAMVLARVLVPARRAGLLGAFSAWTTPALAPAGENLGAACTTGPPNLPKPRAILPCLGP